MTYPTHAAWCKRLSAIGQLKESHRRCIKFEMKHPGVDICLGKHEEEDAA